MKSFVPLALLLAACTSRPPTPSGPIEFCAAYARTLCAAQAKCGFTATGAIDACAEAVQLRCPSNSPSARKGYQRFDEAVARRCISDLDTTNCEGLPGVVGCQGLLAPAALRDQPCFVGADCVDPNDSCGGPHCAMTCRPSGGLGNPCSALTGCPERACTRDTNLCTPFLAVGDSCNREPCSPSAVCGDSGKCERLPVGGEPCRSLQPSCTASAVCLNGTCKSKAPLNANCQTDNDCLPSLICPSGRCVERFNGGEPCSTGLPMRNDCRFPLTCIKGVCSALKAWGDACDPQDYDCPVTLGCDSVILRCTPRRVVAIGEPCTMQQVCPLRAACQGLLDGGPNVTGTCQLAQLDDPCGATSSDCPILSFCSSASGFRCKPTALGTPCGVSACPPGLFCGRGGLCAKRLPAGFACTFDSDCLEGTVCLLSGDGGPSVCGRGGLLGDRCDFDEACLSPYRCSENTCQAAGRVGQRCLPNRLCLTAKCQPMDDTCVKAAAIGEACAESTDCEAADCVAGTCVARCE